MVTTVISVEPIHSGPLRSLSSWICFANDEIKPSPLFMSHSQRLLEAKCDYLWICCVGDFTLWSRDWQCKSLHLNSLQNSQHHWRVCVQEGQIENRKATVHIINSEHHFFVLTISKFLLLLMPSEIRHAQTHHNHFRTISHTFCLDAFDKKKKRQEATLLLGSNQRIEGGRGTRSRSKLFREVTTYHEHFRPTTRQKPIQHGIISVQERQPDHWLRNYSWNYSHLILLHFVCWLYYFSHEAAHTNRFIQITYLNFIAMKWQENEEKKK